MAKIRAYSTEETQAWVEAYLATDPLTFVSSAIQNQMREVREQVRPHLLAVLRREDAFGSPVPERTHAKSPGTMALLVLERGTIPELKPVLLRWQAQAAGNTYILANIAPHLMAYGSDDLLPAARELLGHRDGDVVGAALRGAREAAEAGRTGPRSREYLWDLAVRQAGAEGLNECRDAIALMKAIDPARTAAVLSEPSFVRLDQPNLHLVIQALLDLGSPPPPAFLLEILEAYRRAPAGSEEREALPVSIALTALAASAPEAALPFAEEVLRTARPDDPYLLECAWLVRFRARGLESAYHAAFDEAKKVDWDYHRISEEHRTVMLISEVSAEVANGGFDQWYYNEGAEFTEETVEALRRVGLHEQARIVEQANGVFGWGGPPKGRDRIERALDGLSESRSERLWELGKELEMDGWEQAVLRWDWERKTRK